MHKGPEARKLIPTFARLGVVTAAIIMFLVGLGYSCQGTERVAGVHQSRAGKNAEMGPLRPSWMKKEIVAPIEGFSDPPYQIPPWEENFYWESTGRVILRDATGKEFGYDPDGPDLALGKGLTRDQMRWAVKSGTGREERFFIGWGLRK